MKNQPYLINALLAALLAAILLIVLVIRTVIPNAVIPPLNIPNIVLISLIALLIAHYINNKATPNILILTLFSALTFGLLPFAAGMATLAQSASFACIGGIVFGITSWLFRMIQDRLSSGPTAKLAPIMSAIGLYLASQCFIGILY